MSRISSAVFSVSRSVMPATGSSSSSSWVSWISSMPISSHCFWPWRQRCRRARRAARSGRSSPASRRSASRSSRRVRANRVAPGARGRSSAPVRGFRTRSGSRTRSAAGTCGRCRDWRSPPRRAGSDRPCRRTDTSPVSGRVLPVTTSIIVVLPAPFGPMIVRSSPWSTTSDMPSSALKPSKLTVTPSR